MEILNVGPLEIIIILALMFIFLGPKDMVKTAQGIGRWVRGITTSPMWREVWGISQDIRELPKKLMEDTGLEEALTDVKQTTQEVANEFNAQIKEAKEAARIPEVEHLRIETNPTIAPPAGSVSAALGARVETNAAAEQPPALVQVAEEATAPVVRKPRRKKLPAEAAPAAAAAGDVLDAPVKVKKPRRKKSDAPVEAVGTEPENAEMAAATERGRQRCSWSTSRLPRNRPLPKRLANPGVRNWRLRLRNQPWQRMQPWQKSQAFRKPRHRPFPIRLANRGARNWRLRLLNQPWLWNQPWRKSRSLRRLRNRPRQKSQALRWLRNR